MSEPVTYDVTVGHENQDYAIGDYLNAINELTHYFEAKNSRHDFEDFADALELYAKNLRK